ncbi:MAG: peptidase [Candidatus Dactylopiibacterium carminicum]|nr:MAG: peptidase [Candidatus Dactylopiibacterium carminicum]
MSKYVSRAMLAAGVLSLFVAGSLTLRGNEAQAQAATPTPQAAALRAALPDFSGLVDQVGPAVVNIAVTSVDRSRRNITFDENDPFYEFFRRFGMPAPGTQGGDDQPRVQQGVGSGFIIDAEGYILTNAHVVENATEVTVKLTDKREFNAKVLGADKRTDVALIKIDAKGLPKVRLGNPDNARAGNWVVAMGSPFGLENSVTAGIISAKSRKLPDETYVPFIQTDVAINPGNSGGPLINLDGEVVGINSQIYSRSGGYMGISFAIPIDVALKVKEQLQKHGRVQRGKLGVVIQNVDRDLAQSFGLDKQSGALVNSIEQGGPAEKAGLQPGDIILQVDNIVVDESGDLPRIIGERAPGDSVRLKVWRDKKIRDIRVTLGEQASERVALDSGDSNAGNVGGKLGLVVRQINARDAQRLGIAGGLIVEEAAGAAARAGLRQGDVILAVSNQKVNTPNELRKQVEAAGKNIPLLIQRGDVQQFVVVRTN